MMLSGLNIFNGQINYVHNLLDTNVTEGQIYLRLPSLRNFRLMMTAHVKFFTANPLYVSTEFVVGIGLWIHQVHAQKDKYIFHERGLDHAPFLLKIGNKKTIKVRKKTIIINLMSKIILLIKRKSVLIKGLFS